MASKQGDKKGFEDPLAPPKKGQVGDPKANGVITAPPGRDKPQNPGAPQNTLNPNQPGNPQTIPARGNASAPMMNKRADIPDLIPPNFSENSNKLISNKMFKQNIQNHNPFKDPKWHPLGGLKPDVLPPTSRMVRIDRKKLFTPDEDDVYHIENEVNYYRSQRERNEMEVTRLMQDKEHYLNEIQAEDEYAEKEEFLQTLSIKDREYKNQLEQLRARRLALEQETRQMESIVRQPPPQPVYRAQAPQIETHHLYEPVYEPEPYYASPPLNEYYEENKFF